MGDFWMKKILFCLILLFSCTVRAQLIEAGSAIGIGTQMANNSINMVKKALHTAEAQDIINKVKLEVINFKATAKNYYNKAKVEARKIPLLAKYEGTIESSSKEIVVTLFHVRQYECEQMSQLGAKLINLNNGKYDPLFCQYDNIMKFIFD